MILSEGGGQTGKNQSSPSVCAVFNEFQKSLPHPTHLSCRNTRSPSRYALEFIGFTRVYWRVGVFGGIKNARAHGTICIFLLLLLNVPHSAKPPAHLRCAVHQNQHGLTATVRLRRSGQVKDPVRRVRSWQAAGADATPPVGTRVDDFTLTEPSTK